MSLFLKNVTYMGQWCYISPLYAQFLRKNAFSNPSLPFSILLLTYISVK